MSGHERTTRAESSECGQQVSGGHRERTTVYLYVFKYSSSQISNIDNALDTALRMPTHYMYTFDIIKFQFVTLQFQFVFNKTVKLREESLLVHLFSPVHT